MPKLKVVGNGMKRHQLSKHMNPKNRLPITQSILRIMKQQWSTRAQEYDIIMYWAVACMAFFGFFRLEEIIFRSGNLHEEALHLCAGDVTVDNTVLPTVIQVYLG